MSRKKTRTENKPLSTESGGTRATNSNNQNNNPFNTKPN